MANVAPGSELLPDAWSVSISSMGQFGASDNNRVLGANSHCDWPLRHVVEPNNKVILACSRHSKSKSRVRERSRSRAY